MIKNMNSMKSYFEIKQSCTSYIFRPPISYKIREYLEKFVVENILDKRKIIQGGKWKVHLSMIFVESGQRHTLRHVFLGKGSRTVTAETVKIYEILIPLICIQESKTPLLATIELMYEALKIFFTQSYKSISSDFIGELWNQVDLDYLLSLPYPAPLKDQKYVGDEISLGK